MHRLPNIIKPLLSVAAAIVTAQGNLIEANAGFLRLLGPNDRNWLARNIAHFFIQPTFAELAANDTRPARREFSGLMTIGDFIGETRTLSGRVRRTPEELVIVAEYDIEEIEQVAKSIECLNEGYVLSQRVLAADNVALKSREAEVVEASLTDQLTGVGNRRKLDQAFKTEVARVHRTGAPLSAFMADIDHFKKINDNYGHSVGDKVLAGLGTLLRAKTRVTDIITRFGGEEFLVLMPATSLPEAKEVAERVRMALADQCFEPLPAPTTASFGVAQFLTDETPQAFLQRLDNALYKAKNSGRNAVVLATGK